MSNSSSRRVNKRIKSVKLKARSGLIIKKISFFSQSTIQFILELKSDEDWHKYNYYKTFDVSLDSAPDNIERIDGNHVSVEDFIEYYERPYKPVVIQNTQTDWLTKEKWTIEVISSFKTPPKKQ